MQTGRDIQFCLWIVRRWYFSFPAIGILYAVIHLVARGGAGLSPLQMLGLVGIMAGLSTVFFGAFVLLVELLLRIVRRTRK